MAYVRGNSEDYDNWAKLGNVGWSYKDVLPYFKKSENHQQIESLDPNYHGISGELNVTLPLKFKTPYVDSFISACENIGIPKNDDYNGKNQTGAGCVHSTIKNGKRHSGARAFLKPIMKRSNLSIITNALVSKIILDDNKAKGVEFIKNSKNTEVFVNKEIILSAGSFQSPQILMLSGIGDLKELKKIGVNCKHNLVGVGKNLQDHVFYPICAKTKTNQGINHYISPFNQIKAGLNYFLKNKGVFCTGPLEGLSLIHI